MPAAAVIPAPIAYIKAVAVKKLVVGFRGEMSPVRREFGEYRFIHLLPPVPHPLSLTRVEDVRGREGGNLFSPGARTFYLEEIRVFKAGVQKYRH